MIMWKVNMVIRQHQNEVNRCLDDEGGLCAEVGTASSVLSEGRISTGRQISGPCLSQGWTAGTGASSKFMRATQIICTHAGVSHYIPLTSLWGRCVKTQVVNIRLHNPEPFACCSWFPESMICTVCVTTSRPAQEPDARMSLPAGH